METRIIKQQDESYNGWGNYQTWKVALNIDNDENLYNESREQIRRFRIRKGEDLKAWFKEIAFASYLGEDVLYKVFDTWTKSELNEVDFDEIFTAFNSEIEEEDKEDERGED